MKIIGKSECILFYSVNAKYFDKYNEVFCVGRSTNHWITSESDTGTFIYDLKLVAYDLQSGESFIECKSEMTCTAKMENEFQDALQMLAVLRAFHQSINLFISHNSLSHSSKLS
jgi:predicted component of type VI protein secretion system